MPSLNMSDFASLFFNKFNLSIGSDLNLMNISAKMIFGDEGRLDMLFHNGSSEGYEDSGRDPLYLVVPISIIYSLIFVAGIVGNVSTCIVIMKNRCMHTATNYYLYSLAISDLILLVSGLPPDVYRMWYPDVYIFGEVSCVLLGLSSETSANATVLTITAFTVERYIAICHPFLSHTMSKLSRVVKFIIAIWIVALCLAIPQAIQFGIVYSIEDDKMISSCTVKWEMVEHSFEISGFVFFVGPMTVITVLYVLIGIKLRTSRLLRTSKKSSLNGGGGHELNGTNRSYKNNVSQSRAIKMLVAVAVSFFLCWAPFHSQRLLAVYGKNSTQATSVLLQAYKVLTYVSGVLYFLSTAINPFLYNIMSNKFREAFKNTIGGPCCGIKSQNRRPAFKSACSNRSRVRKRQCSVASRQTALTNIAKTNNNHDTHNNRPRVHRSISEVISNESFTTKVRRAMFGSLKFDQDQDQDNGMAAFPLTDMAQRHRSDSLETARSHSISNSSLQDMDGEEFTGKELANYMETVNNEIS